jgi:hypothetical protein
MVALILASAIAGQCHMCGVLTNTTSVAVFCRAAVQRLKVLLCVGCCKPCFIFACEVPVNEWLLLTLSRVLPVRLMAAVRNAASRCWE